MLRVVYPALENVNNYSTVFTTDRNTIGCFFVGYVERTAQLPQIVASKTRLFKLSMFLVWQSQILPYVICTFPTAEFI